MTRKVNWQDAFWAAVERERPGAFVWGERDCVLVAARVCDAILEQPRLELAARVFGPWASAREAASVIESIGGLRSATASVLGTPIKRQNLTQGDLILCSYDDPDGLFEHALGFHDGVTAIVPGDRKLVSVGASHIVCGWRVG